MSPRRSIAIFIADLPPPDESFLDRELEALERLGQPFVVVSMTGPRSAMAIVRALFRRPHVIFACALRSVAMLPMAAELAERLPKMGIAHVHAHYATDAATLAWMVWKLCGIPYSITVHAHALFVQRALLREKVRDAVFVRTISEFNRRFLESLYPEETRGKVYVVRVGALECGGNADRVKTSPLSPTRSIGESIGERTPHPSPLPTPPDHHPRGERGLTFGALHIACPPSDEPHKGVPVFLEACRMLHGNLRCTVGDLDSADIVVQPSVIAPNGQMDGIPIALIDAMAAGKAVIASAISGIPELVVHGETGLLVDPANPRMLADAIRRLADDPALRARLGANAKEKVAREFCLDESAKQLIALLEKFA